ncbi:MAG TPA: hypothetical protein VGI58_07275 [Streptosporangiaceae bacterium]
MTNFTDTPGFEPVQAVASLLTALTVPYWIAGAGPSTSPLAP